MVNYFDMAREMARLVDARRGREHAAHLGHYVVAGFVRRFGSRRVALQGGA